MTLSSGNYLDKSCNDLISAVFVLTLCRHCTQIPFCQIYMEMTQNCPENVKSSLSYFKCEQILRGARKTQYSANPNSVEEAVLAISEPNPFNNILKGIITIEDQLTILFCSSALLQILSGSQ